MLAIYVTGTTDMSEDCGTPDVVGRAQLVKLRLQVLPEAVDDVCRVLTRHKAH